MKFPRALLLLTLLSSVSSHAAVNPTNLHRSRYSSSVTITATGTSASLDGSPFPTGVATPVTAIGYHELTVTDPALTPSTQTYAFIVRNPERGSSEDGIPTMRPWRIIMDAPSAFQGNLLSVLAPAQYPVGLPVPVMARLSKGPHAGTAAGDPLFLNGLVRSTQFPATPILLRRGWGSTILPPASTAGTAAYDAEVNGLSQAAPITFETNPSWTTKSGNLASSENWGTNARIHVTGTITIPAGVTITIGAGSVVRCAPGAEFWVRPGGSVSITGTAQQPVTFVPDSTSAPWGGFWLQPASGANTAQLTASHTLFCCWGANQNWFATAPAGEPAKNFPRHRNQQPCVAVAPGAICTLTDCALIGPTGLNQTRGAAFAANGGSLLFTRLLVQRCITGGEQEDCPAFEIDSSAFLEMTDPGTDVDSDAFIDADNDGLYLVPDGRTFNLRKTVVGWVKDDGVDTGADGPGTVNFYGCWFENAIHEGISNSGVDRVPRSYGGVHFNCGQGMECGYGGPRSLLSGCAVIGNMVGARFGDNYGNNSGSSGSGTSQYIGNITTEDSLLLYNYFRDAWAMDFSRWTPSNERFIMKNTKVTRAPDLAAQNGTEDSGNSLWNPSADASLLASFMPVPGSAVGIDFPVARRQETTATWPQSFTVRLSTFSSLPVQATWRIAARSRPEDTSETTLGSGSLSWLPGETIKSFSLALPSPNPHGLITVTLGNPLNGEITGAPLLFFPPSGPPPADLTLVARAASGWSYHAALPPTGWTNASPWPLGDSAGRAWHHPDFTEPTTWYRNRTTPLGWGTIGATGATIAFGTSIAERPITVYARRTFTIANPSAIRSLRLECMADDGAVAWINGTRVSPTSWGLDPGTTVGGAIHYDRLSTRFQANGTNEHAYDVLTLSGASLPALLPAPALNVLAIEVHQNTFDSSDCSLDGALFASLAAPSTGTAGITPISGTSWLYWTDAAWTPETTSDLGNWISRPDLRSPVPLLDAPRRQFYRLRTP
jgi:hypothetical protein